MTCDDFAYSFGVFHAPYPGEDNVAAFQCFIYFQQPLYSTHTCMRMQRLAIVPEAPRKGGANFLETSGSYDIQTFSASHLQSCSCQRNSIYPLQSPVITICVISPQITVTAFVNLSHPEPKMGLASHLFLDPRLALHNYFSYSLSWSPLPLPSLFSAPD